MTALFDVISSKHLTQRRPHNSKCPNFSRVHEVDFEPEVDIDDCHGKKFTPYGQSRLPSILRFGHRTTCFYGTQRVKKRKNVSSKLKGGVLTKFNFKTQMV